MNLDIQKDVKSKTEKKEKRKFKLMIIEKITNQIIEWCKCECESE